MAFPSYRATKSLVACPLAIVLDIRPSLATVVAYRTEEVDPSWAVEEASYLVVGILPS